MECPNDSSKYKCCNGKCVSKRYIDDNDDDCGDGSDENGQWMTCHSGTTGITSSLNCPTDASKYQCCNGKCVTKSYIGDGDDDCGDESDENGQWMNCNGPTQSAPESKCENCQEGRIAPNDASTECNECGPGRFADQTNQICARCADGSVRGVAQINRSKFQCEPCRAGEYAASTATVQASASCKGQGCAVRVTRADFGIPADWDFTTFRLSVDVNGDFDSLSQNVALSAFINNTELDETMKQNVTRVCPAATTDAACLLATDAPSQAYVCSQKSTISGTADILLANGKDHDEGYTQQKCKKECTDKPACRSFVFDASSGYCEMWSKTGPLNRPGRYGYDYEVCAKPEHAVCTCLLGSSRFVDSSGCQRCQETTAGSAVLEARAICTGAPSSSTEQNTDACNSSAAFEPVAVSGGSCRLADYVENDDFVYHTTGTSSQEKCAMACQMQRQKCTGFEINKKTRDCVLWFYNACSRTSVAAWQDGGGSQTADRFTHVLKPACAPQMNTCHNIDITTLLHTEATSLRAFTSNNVEVANLRFTIEASRIDAVCRQCEAGQFQSSPGSTKCTRCPEGQYQPGSGSQACLRCKPGESSREDRKGCQGCPAGSVKIGSATECAQCSTGTFAKSAEEACVPCSAEVDNQVQPRPGQTSCLTCGMGSDTWTYADKADQPCRTGCAPDCTAAMQNDTKCDMVCNTYACGFDAGYCSIKLIESTLNARIISVTDPGAAIEELALIAGHSRKAVVSAPAKTCANTAKPCEGETYHLLCCEMEIQQSIMQQASRLESNTRISQTSTTTNQNTRTLRGLGSWSDRKQSFEATIASLKDITLSIQQEEREDERVKSLDQLRGDILQYLASSTDKVLKGLNASMTTMLTNVRSDLRAFQDNVTRGHQQLEVGLSKINIQVGTVVTAVKRIKTLTASRTDNTSTSRMLVKLERVSRTQAALDDTFNIVAAAQNTDAADTGAGFDTNGDGIMSEQELVNTVVAFGQVSMMNGTVGGMLVLNAYQRLAYVSTDLHTDDIQRCGSKKNASDHQAQLAKDERGECSIHFAFVTKKDLVALVEATISVDEWDLVRPSRQWHSFTNALPSKMALQHLLDAMAHDDVRMMYQPGHQLAKTFFDVKRRHRARAQRQSPPQPQIRPVKWDDYYDNEGVHKVYMEQASGKNNMVAKHQHDIYNQVEITTNILKANPSLPSEENMCRVASGLRQIWDQGLSTIGLNEPKVDKMTMLGVAFSNFAYAKGEEPNNVFGKTVQGERIKKEYSMKNAFLISQRDVNAVVSDSSNGVKVVAFRGTAITSVSDIWTDVNVFAVKCTLTDDCGRVHAGFQANVMAIYETLESRILESLEDDQDTKLLITGHSLGAALAHLFTMRLLHRNVQLRNRTAVRTFGTPRFCALYTTSGAKILNGAESPCKRNHNSLVKNSFMYKAKCSKVSTDTVTALPTKIKWEHVSGFQTLLATMCGPRGVCHGITEYYQHKIANMSLEFDLRDDLNTLERASPKTCTADISSGGHTALSKRSTAKSALEAVTKHVPCGSKLNQWWLNAKHIVNTGILKGLSWLRDKFPDEWLNNGLEYGKKLLDGAIKVVTKAKDFVVAVKDKVVKWWCGVWGCRRRRLSRRNSNSSTPDESLLDMLNEIPSEYFSQGMSVSRTAGEAVGTYSNYASMKEFITNGSVPSGTIPLLTVSASQDAVELLSESDQQDPAMVELVRLSAEHNVLVEQWRYTAMQSQQQQMAVTLGRHLQIRAQNCMRSASMCAGLEHTSLSARRNVRNAEQAQLAFQALDQYAVLRAAATYDTLVPLKPPQFTVGDSVADLHISLNKWLREDSTKHTERMDNLCNTDTDRRFFLWAVHRSTHPQIFEDLTKPTIDDVALPVYAEPNSKYRRVRVYNNDVRVYLLPGKATQEKECNINLELRKEPLSSFLSEKDNSPITFFLPDLQTVYSNEMCKDCKFRASQPEYNQKKEKLGSHCDNEKLRNIEQTSPFGIWRLSKKNMDNWFNISQVDSIALVFHLEYFVCGQNGFCCGDTWQTETADVTGGRCKNDAPRSDAMFDSMAASGQCGESGSNWMAWHRGGCSLDEGSTTRSEQLPGLYNPNTEINLERELPGSTCDLDGWATTSTTTSSSTSTDSTTTTPSTGTTTMPTITTTLAKPLEDFCGHDNYNADEADARSLVATEAIICSNGSAVFTKGDPLINGDDALTCGVAMRLENWRLALTNARCEIIVETIQQQCCTRLPAAMATTSQPLLPAEPASMTSNTPITTGYTNSTSQTSSTSGGGEPRLDTNTRGSTGAQCGSDHDCLLSHVCRDFLEGVGSCRSMGNAQDVPESAKGIDGTGDSDGGGLMFFGGIMVGIFVLLAAAAVAYIVKRRRQRGSQRFGALDNSTPPAVTTVNPTYESGSASKKKSLEFNNPLDADGADDLLGTTTI